jgi:hypothetical protein
VFRERKNGCPLSDNKCFTEARHQIKYVLLPSWEKNGFKINEFDAVLKKFGGEISYTNKFLETISKEMKEMKWVDIEEIYYKQMLSLMKYLDKKEVFQKIEKLNKDFERIKKALEKYLEREVKRNVVSYKNIEDNIYNSIVVEEITKSGIKIIEEKLGYRLEDIPSGTYSYEELGKVGLHIDFEDNIQKIIPEEMLFLNFNYTTIAKNYPNKKIGLKVMYIQIHGELSNPDNPIIFGYGDELDDMYPAIEKTNDNRFLENVKSIRYLETGNYKQLLNFVESDLYQICVFGHSCGISDRTLLNTLFEHKNCVSIKVFYHQKEDGTDNYSDVVRNISRNFTDKAAMRMKVANKKDCRPLKGNPQQE